MKKMIFFWVYFVVAIILAIYFVSRVITNNMDKGPIRETQDIIIFSDSNNIDSEHIKTEIHVTNGMAIEKPEEINNRAKQLPLIKNAATRFLPNGVYIIKIQKHDIVGIWTDDNKYYPLSSEGYVVPTPMDTPLENFIIFKSSNRNDPDEIRTISNNLAEIVNIVSPLSNKIEYIEPIESRRWNIYLKNGIIIYLPEEGVKEAVNHIVELDKQKQILSRAIKIIDMRNIDLKNIDNKILVKTKK